MQVKQGRADVEHDREFERCSGMAKETYNKPTEVVAEDGRVMLDGPDGVERGRDKRVADRDDPP